MLQSVLNDQPMREDLTWLLEEEWYTNDMESGFETQKSIHKAIFGDSKVT